LSFEQTSRGCCRLLRDRHGFSPAANLWILLYEPPHLSRVLSASSRSGGLGLPLQGQWIYGQVAETTIAVLVASAQHGLPCRSEGLWTTLSPPSPFAPTHLILGGCHTKARDHPATLRGLMINTSGQGCRRRRIPRGLLARAIQQLRARARGCVRLCRPQALTTRAMRWQHTSGGGRAASNSGSSPMHESDRGAIQAERTARRLSRIPPCAVHVVAGSTTSPFSP